MAHAISTWRNTYTPYPSNHATKTPPGARTAEALTRKSPSNLNNELIIQQALKRLGEIKNLPQDELMMQQLGIQLIYHTGQEALKVIQSNGIQVVFGDMGDSAAHAQWLADQNLIVINQRYQGDNSPETLDAISAAIYHEAGHAAKIATDPNTGSIRNLSLNPWPQSATNAYLPSTLPNVGDDQSSIQEELNCLALNTLAHRYQQFSQGKLNVLPAKPGSPLIENGVALYTRLFFDPDPARHALVNRVIEKYGDLPLSSPGHLPPLPVANQPFPLAYRVASQIIRNAGQSPRFSYQA